MGCTQSLGRRSPNLQKTCGPSENPSSFEFNTSAAAPMDKAVEEEEDRKKETRVYLESGSKVSEDMPSRTACILAAQEYTSLVSSRGVRNDVSGTNKQERPDTAPEPIQLRVGFTVSHRELLGRCWDSRSIERLSIYIVRATTPSWRGVIPNYSLGRDSIQRESSGSHIFFNLSPGIPSAASLPSFDGLSRRSPLTKCAQHRCSHWVSLVYPVQTAVIGQRRSTDTDQRGETGAYISKKDCSRLVSVPVSHGGADGKETQQQQHVPGFSLDDGKDIFAFRLSGEECRNKETSFLRKRGMKVGFGAHLHRWDRVEFVVVDSDSFAAAVVQTQAISVSSPEADAAGMSSLFVLHEGIQTGRRAGGTTAPVSSLMTESFPSDASQSPTSSCVGFIGEFTGFPEKSVLCHCLTLPACRMQSMHEGSVPLTSLSAPIRDKSPFASGRCTGSSNVRATPLPFPPHMTTVSVAGGGSMKKTSPSNGKEAVAGSLKPLAGREMKSTPSKQVDVTSCASFPLDYANNKTSVPVLASIVVNSFDVSIDPFRWREKRYHRTPVNYADARPSVRQQYGEGVVTCVMYGGVCLVECSSPVAVTELKEMLQKVKWGVGATQRRKALVTGVKKRFLKNDKMKNGVSDTLAANEHSPSGVPILPAETMPHELYRVVCRVGGVNSGGKSHTKQRNSISSLGTASTSVTPWVGLKAMTKLVCSWALHLLCNPEFTEPIALYVQRFAGIIPSLRLTSLEGHKPHYTQAKPGGDDDKSGNGNNTDDDEEEEYHDADDKDDGYFGRRQKCEDSFLLAVDKIDRLSRSSDEASCIPMRSVAHSDGASTFTTGIPAPNVINTGRALTIFRDEDFQVSSPNWRSRRTISTVLSDSVRRGSATSSLWHLWKTQPIVPPKLKQKTKKVYAKQQSIMHDVTVPSLSCMQTTGDEMQVCSSSLKGKDWWMAERVSPSSSTLLPHSQKGDKGGVEDETLWGQFMLEVKALENELQDVLHARREMDELHEQVNTTLGDLQRAFLPNTPLEALEPLFSYMNTVVEFPMELPEQCSHFDGPDWFPCLAAVLTSSKNSLHCVTISHPMRISSLPKLGMLAGVLFHDNAMGKLRSLTICCRGFCGATSCSSSFSNIEKQGKRSPSFVWCDDGVSSSDLPFVHDFQRGPPFFVTPEQAKNIFLTLTDAVLSNVKQPSFVIRLKEFPGQEMEARLTGIRRLIYTVFDPSGGSSRSRNSKRVTKTSNCHKGPMVVEPSHSRVSSQHSSFNEDEEEIKNTQGSAERRAYCMLLRHWEWTPTRHPSHFCHASGNDKTDNPEGPVTQWVYGLRSHHLELAVLRHAEMRILARAPFIFNDLQDLIKSHSIPAADSSEGRKEMHFKSEVFLVR